MATTNNQPIINKDTLKQLKADVALKRVDITALNTLASQTVLLEDQDLQNFIDASSLIANLTNTSNITEFKERLENAEDYLNTLAVGYNNTQIDLQKVADGTYNILSPIVSLVNVISMTIKFYLPSAFSLPICDSSKFDNGYFTTDGSKDEYCMCPAGFNTFFDPTDKGFMGCIQNTFNCDHRDDTNSQTIVMQSGVCYAIGD